MWTSIPSQALVKEYRIIHLKFNSRQKQKLIFKLHINFHYLLIKLVYGSLCKCSYLQMFTSNRYNFWFLISFLHINLPCWPHNTLCSTQPAYLHSLLNYHTPTCSRHSANSNLLSVPRVRTTFASRGFRVAVWNSLPSGIHNSSSTDT